MAYSNQDSVKKQSSLRSLSPQLLERFSNPLDCLTAHLMLECSEVLAGVKPANLISLVNRTRSCGRNLYQLWHQYHDVIAIRLADITFMVLHVKQKALLLLCYNNDQLERHLAHAGIRNLLHKAGYAADVSCEELLKELRGRIDKNTSFPHEIGLFIGYPAKDVAAFMGMVTLPFTCQGPWKIFGDPKQSLGLAEQYRCCRQRMCAVLASGEQSVLELNSPGHPFFCRTIDKQSQYR